LGLQAPELPFVFPLEQADLAGRHRVGKPGLKRGDERGGT
jgi:hypothetical protein